MHHLLRRPLVAGCLAILLVIAASLAGRGRAAPQPPGGNADEQPPDASGPMIDPFSVNATCCVCHIPFVREEMSKVHFAEQITCIECHGLSAAHANDEDVGATKPDITYPRTKVDTMCIKCHENHDVPARDIIARFVQRKLPATTAICTDCHGHHRIESAIEAGEE